MALGTREGKIYEAHSSKRLQHSEYLIPLIEKLLKTIGPPGRSPRCVLESIDAFAICRGPGSFTGLRIGFGFLKGFLAVRKKPCYGAVSLDMIAAPIQLPEGSRLGVVVDARRERLYARFYRFRSGRWAAEGNVRVFSLPQLKAQIREGITLVGDGLVLWRGALEETFGNRIHFLHPASRFPSARTLVTWFQKGDSRLVPLWSPRDLKPLYFRSSEAEENRRKFIVTHGR